VLLQPEPARALAEGGEVGFGEHLHSICPLIPGGDAAHEALIQANVPPPAARRAAESLEKDMTSTLATKQDLQHLDQLMTARFDALETRVSLKMEHVESRIVIKLGALMTLLFGVSTALVTLLR
jgi:hypothetical protein